MKKSSMIVLGAIGAVVVLAIVYRAVNRAPSADLPVNEQLEKVLADGGCASCHSANPQLPFYANLPLADNLIGQHVKDGYASFDIAPFIEVLQN